MYSNMPLALIDNPAVIIALIVLAFVVIMGLIGLKTVQQANVILIERFGRYHRTLQPGINIIWPVVDKCRALDWRVMTEGYDGAPVVTYVKRKSVDLREQVLDFPRQQVITKDNVVIGVNGLLYYQITDANRAVYEINNLPIALEKLAQTTLRNIIGDLDLDSTLTSRDDINGKMRKVLDDASDKWGVKVNRVELQDIVPPESVREAMEKQMTAERARRATIIEAEGIKESKILRAEGERGAEIARAEGQRQALILEAEGEASARMSVAEGEAQALIKVNEALANTKMDGAEYRVAMRYLDTLAKIGSGGEGTKTVFLPFESSAALGGLGAIQEILKGKS
ncbi:MAG: regulator of protease activity HflC (stomatin/prohibitin superfamily) [Planctomycetota bacterium]|jgi:regulator of protease activity HflC (stomatin/prohibitin superfamily)